MPKPIRSVLDSVSCLKGCGKISTNKLNSHGIYTYKDLIGYIGNIPGVNLDVLKTLALDELRNTKEIDAHNWKDRIGHVIRAKGQVTRAVIENLIVGPHRVLLMVRWQSKGKTRRKAVSPVALLCAQILWIANDIISDDSDDESCEPMDSSLPKFLIDIENSKVNELSNSELKAVHSVIKETNQLYNCVYS
jgi:hypothetical protein